MMQLLNQLPLERCPHCNVDNPNISQLISNPTSTSNFNGQVGRIWMLYSCRRCGGAVLAAANSSDGNKRVIEIYPKPQDVDITIPEKAREFLKQAILSRSAPAGAIMLAASSVDAMLKEIGLKEGTLYKRIDTAKDNNTITESMAQWAHQVRLDANDQRHADDNAPLPTPTDADRAIAFVQALGEFLFVLPSRVKKGIQESTPTNTVQ